MNNISRYSNRDASVTRYLRSIQAVLERNNVHLDLARRRIVIPDPMRAITSRDVVNILLDLGSEPDAESSVDRIELGVRERAITRCSFDRFFSVLSHLTEFGLNQVPLLEYNGAPGVTRPEFDLPEYFTPDAISRNGISPFTGEPRATFNEVLILDKLLPDHVFVYNGKKYTIDPHVGTFCEVDDHPDRFYLPEVGYYDFERKMLILENNYSQLEDINSSTLKDMLSIRPFSEAQYIQISQNIIYPRESVDEYIISSDTGNMHLS